jgi:two-component system chemotaxis response regulator CheB
VKGRDIVVIGASAGGIAALRQLASVLPTGLPASLFVVVHSSPDAPGLLPEVLTGAGALPARFAVHGEEFQPGHI